MAYTVHKATPSRGPLRYYKTITSKVMAVRVVWTAVITTAISASRSALDHFSSFLLILITFLTKGSVP